MIFSGISMGFAASKHLGQLEVDAAFQSYIEYRVN